MIKRKECPEHGAHAGWNCEGRADPCGCGRKLVDVEYVPRPAASPEDDEARERAMYALCRFIFPGYVVPRSEMVDAVIVALAGEGDWKSSLPAKRAAVGQGWNGAG